MPLGKGVEQSKQAIGLGSPPREHRFVHHLVKHDGEVEHREANDYRTWEPEIERLESEGSECTDAEEQELPTQYEKMKHRLWSMHLLQRFLRKDIRQTLAEGASRIRPMRGRLLARRLGIRKSGCRHGLYGWPRKVLHRLSLRASRPIRARRGGLSL